MSLKSDSQDWLTSGYQHIWMPYTQMKTAPLPEKVVATNGTRIILEDGRELIDGIASWWSACHGYNHPYIKNAIASQLDIMPHVMLAGLAHEQAFVLSQRLAALSPGDLDRVFLSESGSVSVEIALKIAVQYWLNLGQVGKNKFVAFKNGYHGDTIGTMAIGDPDNIMHGPFHGLMCEQLVIDLPTEEGALAIFDRYLENHANQCAAVILEPLVQGAGGMIFHDDSVVRAIRKSCDRHQVLLILDEIMVGLGRLGSMTASELIGIQPDILTLSKSLTGGMLPLAATISSARIFDAFQSDDLEKCLMHGPTFTGNALACAAANASLDLFEMEPRLSQVHQIESHLLQALTVCCDFPGVVDVRVRGAIGVVQLIDLGDFYWIRRRFVEKGVWLRPFGNVVYIMPAFSIDQGDLTKVTDTMIEIIGEWSDQYVGKLG